MMTLEDVVHRTTTYIVGHYITQLYVSMFNFYHFITFASESGRVVNKPTNSKT